MTTEQRILLVGLGGFGRNHLRAWIELGRANDLWVADLSPALLAEAREFGIPAERVTQNWKEALDSVAIVDIVTGTDSHHELAAFAIEAGKDVFLEKPMTLTSDEAGSLAEMARSRGAVIQVGYYYRCHPMSILLRSMIQGGELGDLRYLSGEFMGFKRARTDVGVTHTDAIHFFDLFNWLVGAPPTDCFAVTRDHFGRGMEDTSLVIFEYPGKVLAKVESGYIQPGAWRDKVVPGAFTTKTIYVVGSRATVEVDYETETMTMHDVHHENDGVTWVACHGGSRILPVETCPPLSQIKAELTGFLASVRERSTPGANAIAAGTVLAKMIDGVYESADQRCMVGFNWTPEEEGSLTAERQP